MYIVKATDHRGPMSFAFGTAGLALGKVYELAGRGIEDIVIKDPKGREWTAAAFEMSLGQSD